MALLLENNVLSREPPPASQLHVSEEWSKQLGPHKLALRLRDKTLMTEEIPLLLELKIPAFWVSGHFDTPTKTKIWDYLNHLYESAHKIEGEEEQELRDLPHAPNTFSDSMEQTLQHLHFPPAITEMSRAILPKVFAGLDPTTLLQDPDLHSTLTTRIASELGKNLTPTMCENVGREMRPFMRGCFPNLPFPADE